MRPQPHSNSRPADLSRAFQRLANWLGVNSNAPHTLSREPLKMAFVAPAALRPAENQGRALRRWMVARLRAERGLAAFVAAPAGI